MNPAFIFLPSFALVLLTYIVLFYMFGRRVAGIKKHQARIQSLADPVREAEVFKDAVNPAENFENLFEMPVLFFAASIIIYVLAKVDVLYLYLTSLYVILRVMHSYIHCTSNRVKYRFRFFTLSIVVLLLIWVRIAVQILLS